MTHVATAPAATPTLRDIAQRFAPRSLDFDFLGIGTGYRAWLIYTGLNARSDAELQRLGLDRIDLPRIAWDAATA